MSVSRARLGNLRIAGVALVAAMLLPASALASAHTIDVTSLAHALRRNPVQVVGAPALSLSASSVRPLRERIRREDPGRIWIAVAPSMSQRPTSRLSNALSGNLNADGGGTVVVVAGGSVWGSTSWEDGPAATARLQAAFQNSHEPLASQLRKVIDSFASGDAAAGHPQLGSASDTGGQSPTQTQTKTQTQPTGSSTAGEASSSSSSPVGLIIGLVVLAIALALVLLRGGRRMRRTMRASHRHKQEQADQREQVQADFIKLGEAIGALDIDSSMPNASAHGKDEYAKAMDCYQQAERRLEQSRDEYQFERATAAVKEGLEHVNAAERLLNQTEGRPAGG